MKLKEWAFMGNYDFYTNKLQVLAANELPPEKWSYAGKNDFGILKNYLSFTFEKWKRILPKFDRRFNCVCEKKN